MAPVLDWPAIAAARSFDTAARVPLFIDGQAAGSVHRAHLQDLRAWPQCLAVGADRVELLSAAGPARNDVLAVINARLHEQGLIRGWRHEAYAVTALQGGEVMARIERAASRFWGTLTCGAHATGYVADAEGRPTHVWIARRSATKPTDPGLLDNLVGGGVADGQTPWQTLVREGWEEAGLSAAQMARARPGRVIRLHREVGEGLQLEDLYSHDLELPAGVVPRNQDGEVAGFDCLPVPEALALAASAAMTVDASLVTLDFALRHRLCAEPPGALALMRYAG